MKADPPIVGKHPSILWLRQKLRLLGRTNEPVVIVGQPGVGKSLVAAHLHYLGPFRDRPIRSLDVAIAGERTCRRELLGAELLHETTTGRGLLELETTVVIKQIDCANEYVQHRLASALSSRRVTREGAKKSKPVACRPLFTLTETPADLAGKRRLYPSLADALAEYPSVTIPPLDRRREDIPALIGSILSEYLRELLRPDILLEPWLENITELKSYLRNLVVISHTEVERSREGQEFQKMLMMVEEGKPFSVKQSLARIEEGIVERALARSSGRQADAARLLGLTDRTIRRHMSKLI